VCKLKIPQYHKTKSEERERRLGGFKSPIVYFRAAQILGIGFYNIDMGLLSLI
jgi:hypothetical protein